MSLNIKTNISIININEIKDVDAGTWISYTGNLLTMRDSTHIKMLELYKKNNNIPFDLNNKIVLYAAPTSGEKIIIGPTTSIRMDAFLEFLFKQGVLATIGKGKRTDEAVQLIKKYQRPYFILLSGVSAYLSDYFFDEKIIAFPELGPEALREYKVKNLPLLVSIDAKSTLI